jgi:hypothetical protein
LFFEIVARNASTTSVQVFVSAAVESQGLETPALQVDESVSANRADSVIFVVVAVGYFKSNLVTESVFEIKSRKTFEASVLSQVTLAPLNSLWIGNALFSVS